ncbi:MAG: uracil phosphoribosyltransferase [Bacteroidota bacterium]
MPFILSEQNTLANQFLLELRDANIQQDRLRFRKNMERLGEIMAYEVSRKLKYDETQVKTQLGVSTLNVLKEQPVLLTILRAGLPFFQGFQNFFDQADCGFIGAYRLEDEHDVTIKLEYVATTSLEGRCVIVIDPMLATGRSVLDSIHAVLKNGTPAFCHIVSLVAAPEGITFLKTNLKIAHALWTCALDEKLNQKFYIVPGLGDAGDLSFGEKI